jgi:hypothetical protein
MTTTIQFLKDHVAPDGKQFRKGEIAVVGDDVAQELAAKRIAKQRIPPGPVEHKGDA